MKRKNEKEIEVIVEGKADFALVPKGIMDAFIGICVARKIARGDLAELLQEKGKL